jgi:hypothetical protein
VELASRGGGSEEPAMPLDGRDALSVDPTTSSENVGFRCAESR